MTVRNKIAVTLSIAVFMVLAGAGAGHAMWSASASSSTTVASGTHSFTLTGFDVLAHPYAATTLVDSAAVRVHNTGTVVAPFALTLTAAAGRMADGVQVHTWPTTAACTAATTVPAIATDTAWTSVPVLKSTLAGGASQYYCVRTTVTTGELESLGGTAVTASAKLNSTLGTNWIVDETRTITQTIADTTPPSRPAAPTATSVSGYSTQLSWPASIDNAGIARYEIRRGGTLIATVTSPSYADTALAPNTTYSYTVRAIDTNGLVSSYSPATSVSTLPINPSAWYTITNPNSTKCVDGNGASQAEGTSLIIWTCNNQANQKWRFVPTTEGFYRMTANNSATLAWSIAPDNVQAQLRTYQGNLTQQWRAVAMAGGSYTLVNRGSGLCLNVTGGGTAAGTLLQQTACDATAGQTFTFALTN